MQEADKTATFGAIYVASGQRYVDEAAVSARSLRAVMPSVSIVLHTDQNSVPDGFDAVYPLVDCRHNCHDKVPPLLQTPFEKTLFLDTDTYVCETMDELSILLDRFDLLVCHTAFRDPNPLKGIPAAFTEFNTGMIAFRRNGRTMAFLNRWLDSYDSMGHTADQPAFRKALWDDPELKVYVLPPEYNFRTIFPGFVGGGSVVKLIHGRHSDWGHIRRKLNRSHEARVVILSPLDRWSSRVIVLRKWSDLFKSALKWIFSLR